MANDTQAPRDANAPGGLGGVDNTARFEGTAMDGAQSPEDGAVETGAP